MSPSIRDKSTYAGGLPRPRQGSEQRDLGEPPITVGIIGAGAAGLYASLIIDSLADPRITYEIFDANPMRGRKGGGRLYTYEFPNGGSDDYFDVGAMRFPDIPCMKLVFDLIRDNPASPIAGILTEDIIECQHSTPEDLSFYNGIVKSAAELSSVPPPLDPFDTKINAPASVTETISLATESLRAPFLQQPVDFPLAWANLMQWDQYSTRAYLTKVNPKCSDAIINYMETLVTSQGLFDQALSETVMIDLIFYGGAEIKWYSIRGGTGKIADAMKSAMTKPVQYDKRAIYIAPVLSSQDTRTSTAKSEQPQATSIDVMVAGEKKPRNYKHVISTMPFSCLRMVDTARCGFSWNLQTAIRALHYGAGVKVGIRFSRRWWEDDSLARGAHHGGASSTDRPARMVLYPSYGINENTGATLIASYTWAEDAVRIGSLANSPSELLVVAGIIKDLADMHQMDHDDLANLVEDYKIHDWSADDTIMGQ
ncbi:hypothetical protein HWV62_17218 [Athelia sp. TMB]|nr:hypothetical protein HWV62_17218 [Athelia sp. TMB]